MAASSASIRIQGLRKTYSRGGAAAVENLSLEIPEGTFFTLLGPSGCGKTTTLRMIAGLEQPDSGEISIGQAPIYSSSKRVNVAPYRRPIGMVFQSYAIWPHMSVFQNVAYPLKNLKKQKHEIEQAVSWALQLVGLGHLSDRPAPLLSGGEQQRVALARALVGNPTVLLLDEPLSNLDAKLREQMRFDLRSLQRQLGLTTVYVTHDQDEAFALSDLMAVMHKGKLVELGSPEAVYQVPETAFGAEFLGAATRIPGRVRRDEGAGTVLVSTPLGELVARSRTPGEAGQEVAVYLRPEDIHVLPGDLEGDGQVVTAEVARASFMGGVVEWWADAAGFSLRGRSLANTTESQLIRARVGMPVRLSIAVARCVSLTTDAAVALEPAHAS